MLLLNWPPPDHLWIGPQLLRLINIRARHPGTRRAAFPQRHSSKANNLCARIRLDPPKSLRPFKGIICADVSEFESHMPSQPVAFLRPTSVDLSRTLR